MNNLITIITFIVGYLISFFCSKTEHYFVQICIPIHKLAIRIDRSMFNQYVENVNKIR